MFSFATELVIYIYIYIYYSCYSVLRLICRISCRKGISEISLAKSPKVFLLIPKYLSTNLKGKVKHAINKQVNLQKVIDNSSDPGEVSFSLTVYKLFRKHCGKRILARMLHNYVRTECCSWALCGLRKSKPYFVNAALWKAQREIIGIMADCVR